MFQCNRGGLCWYVWSPFRTSQQIFGWSLYCRQSIALSMRPRANEHLAGAYRDLKSVYAIDGFELLWYVLEQWNLFEHCMWSVAALMVVPWCEFAGKFVEVEHSIGHCLHDCLDIRKMTYNTNNEKRFI